MTTDSPEGKENSYILTFFWPFCGTIWVFLVSKLHLTEAWLSMSHLLSWLLLLLIVFSGAIFSFSAPVPSSSPPHASLLPFLLPFWLFQLSFVQLPCGALNLAFALTIWLIQHVLRVSFCVLLPASLPQLGAWVIRPWFVLVVANVSSQLSSLFQVCAAQLPPSSFVLRVIFDALLLIKEASSDLQSLICLCSFALLTFEV